MFVAPVRLTVMVAVPADSPTEKSDDWKLKTETSSSLIVRTAGLLAPIVGAAPPVKFCGFERTTFTFSADSALESSVIRTWKLLDISPGAKVSVCGVLIGV